MSLTPEQIALREAALATQLEAYFDTTIARIRARRDEPAQAVPEEDAPQVWTLDAQAGADVQCHLQGMTTLRRQGEFVPVRPYLCYEEFVLKHGRQFVERVAKPLAMLPGVPRACFQNAAILATVCPDRYTYCEGYAKGVIPVHHAWVQDREGRVLDITWPEPGTPEMDAYEAECPPAYWGVAFRTDYVERVVMSGVGCCLDNYRERHPLLTGAHMLAQALHRAESEAA